MISDQDRLDFEASWMHFTECAKPPVRLADGDYRSPAAQDAWKWWQRARNAPGRVYLVATGEVRNGMELYERHDEPVPLAECEVLYASAVHAVHTAPQAVQVAVPDVELLRNVITRAISSKTSHHINTAKATFTRDSNNGTALGELVDAIAGDLMAHFPAASAQAVQPLHREWKSALQEAIDTMEAEIDCRGDAENVRRMKRAKAILSQMLAAQPAAQGMDAATLDALQEAESVLNSINMGKQHKVVQADGDVTYWQREEWCKWAKDEVLPKVTVALAAQAKQGSA